MTEAMTIADNAAELLERVLIGGDLSKLTSPERLQYYRAVCESVGLNPLTKPFAYLHLSGKLTLYALRDATDQLRRIHNVSVTITAREIHGDVYVVTARATLPSGRTDESIGAVPIQGLKGEALANAVMKAETKAKRRVTLSICGLGMLDENEIDSIPGAYHVEPVTGETVPALPPTSEAPEEWETVVHDYVECFDKAESKVEAEGWRERWLRARDRVPEPGRKTVEAAITRAKDRFSGAAR